MDSADTLKDRIYMRQSPSPPHGPWLPGHHTRLSFLLSVSVPADTRAGGVLRAEARKGARTTCNSEAERPYAGVSPRLTRLVSGSCYLASPEHSPARGQSGSILYITGPLSLRPPRPLHVQSTVLSARMRGG